MLPEVRPPATRTLPPFNRMAAASVRAVSMAPVVVQELVSGWNISAELVGPPGPLEPPAIRIDPSSRAIQTWEERGASIGGTVVNLPSFRKKLAVASGDAGLPPPERKERPSERVVEQTVEEAAAGWRRADWGSPAHASCRVARRRSAAGRFIRSPNSF